MVIVFNATFNNISVISWPSVLWMMGNLVLEDSIHFFLGCCLYVEAREQLNSWQIICNFLTVHLLKLYYLAMIAYLRNKMHKYS